MPTSQCSYLNFRSHGTCCYIYLRFNLQTLISSGLRCYIPTYLPTLGTYSVCMYLSSMYICRYIGMASWPDIRPLSADCNPAVITVDPCRYQIPMSLDLDTYLGRYNSQHSSGSSHVPRYVHMYGVHFLVRYLTRVRRQRLLLCCL